MRFYFFYGIMKKGGRKDMGNTINSFATYIDESKFYQLLSEAESAEYNKKGGNSKCAIIDNYAIIKTGNIPGYDNIFPNMVDTLWRLKEKGANVVPILGYAITKVGRQYANGERYDSGYIVQEKAKGREILSTQELKGKTSEECNNRVMEYLHLLENAPQEHFDKWVLDYKMITDNKVMIDPSKETNFFYDTEKGFSFIDLNFFAKESDFDKLDDQNCHTIFIAYTMVFLRKLMVGSYDKYLKPDQIEYCKKVVYESFNKYVQAMELVGIYKEEIEKSFERLGMEFPKNIKEENITL